ncbi:hypothetical protein [Fusicatenibacter saccharivorans]|nr:Uncharacterised protein [Fusicatenibacter saccharivorans]
MKDKNILSCVGIIIYIAMSGIDRFVYHIPNIIYIKLDMNFDYLFRSSYMPV